MIKAGQTVSASDIVFSAVAGENLTANDAVYIKTSDGKAYKADADNTGTGQFQGFAQETVSSGGTVNIVHSGQMNGFSGMTIGSPYYVSTTAGAITATAPSNPCVVGYALSATVLKIVRFPSIRMNVFTAGGTWTKLPGLKFVKVRLVGGGGGGYAQANATTSSSDGGTTSFGAHCQATGGGKGAGTPGVGSSGDINLSGGPGQKAAAIGAGVNGLGGIGGGSLLGGGGTNQVTPAGYGGGGGGADSGTGGQSGGNGGSGGGYSEKVILNVTLGATETVTIGAAGAGATGATAGAAGQAGVCIVEEYY